MDKERKNLLFFGFGLAVICSFFALRLGIKYNWTASSWVLWAGAAFFCVVTIFFRSFLKKIYVRWMAVAQVIGNVVTAFILSFLFYVLFGLVGIILRVIRKDLLDRTVDFQRESYWKKRAPVEFRKENYLRQF